MNSQLSRKCCIKMPGVIFHKHFCIFINHTKAYMIQAHYYYIRCISNLNKCLKHEFSYVNSCFDFFVGGEGGATGYQGGATGYQGEIKRSQWDPKRAKGEPKWSQSAPMWAKRSQWGQSRAKRIQGESNWAKGSKINNLMNTI